MKLIELMQLGADHAKTMMVGSKSQFLTQFTLVKPNGHFDVIATPWDDAKEKKRMVLMVCLQALKEAAVSYSFCTEAWFANTTKADLTPPSERPDRKEGIVIIASDAKEHIFEAYDIVRDQEGTCIELKLLAKPDGFESWITDAIDRALLLKDGSIRAKMKDFFPS